MYLLSGATSLHHLTIMTEPSLSCLLCLRVEKGKGKWVRIINILLYVHIRVATCLNETKKGGETSKSKILRILKRGI